METLHTEMPSNHNSTANRDPLIDRAASSAHDVVDRVADQLGPAAGRLRTAALGTADAVQEKVDDLSSIGTEWAESARTYVRDRPITSVGIAVLAGFLLSRWVRIS